MSNRPLVSVVVNFLNAAMFIREAIDSVFSQTYDNWELLLIDDGSTDGSTGIAQDLAATFPARVRYMHHEGHINLGASASRNLGSANAAGEYIAFLDADDVWLPEKLERQVAILEAHPKAAMVFGQALYWYGWSGKAEDIRRDYMPRLDLPFNTLIQPPHLLTAFLRNEDATPFPSSILIRRSADKAIGGFEDACKSIYDDQVYCAKVGLMAPVFASSQCWHRYRLHPGQRCNITVQTGQYHTARLTFLTWLEEFLTRQAGADAEAWQALNRALWPYRHPRVSRLLMQSRRMAGRVRTLGRRTLPPRLREWFRSRWQILRARPMIGGVNFGELRRLEPVSRKFGLDRGLPIDRYYIEEFLRGVSSDIRGDVLEIGDDTYTRRFGQHPISSSTVMHVAEGTPNATLVGDLATGVGVPTSAFDCIILTQTLPFIYDVRGAIRNAYEALKPGGVLLATLPGISQVSRYDMDRWGDYWRFTTLSAERLFAESFGAGNASIQSHGNVLAAVSLLHGLASGELQPDELDAPDADYQVLITIRAIKKQRIQVEPRHDGNARPH